MGHTGFRSKHMGVYVKSTRRAHGYALYTMESGGVTYYLYRAGNTGCWQAVDGEEYIAKNQCYIRATTAAELPTAAGLKWEYDNGNGGFSEDSAMSCVEVRHPDRGVRPMP